MIESVLLNFLSMISNSTLMEMLFFLTPFVIFLELPMITMVIVGVFA